jgi:hypothetical protein
MATRTKDCANAGRIVSLLLFIIPTGLTAQAAQTTWTGAAGNALWDDASNWSVGVPHLGDTAILRNTTAPIQLGGNRDVSVIQVGGTVELVGGEISAGTIELANFGFDVQATLRANVAVKYPSFWTSSFMGTLTIDGAVSGTGYNLFTLGPTVFAGPVALDTPIKSSRLSLAGAGTLLHLPSLELDGGSFKIDNATAALSGRLNPSITIRNSHYEDTGTLSINGNTSTDVTERISRLRADRTGMAVLLSTPGAKVHLHVDDLSIGAGQFLQVQADGSSTRLSTNAVPTQIGGTSGVELPIVRNAYAVSTKESFTLPSGLLTYDTTLANDGDVAGYRQLRDDEYHAGIAGATPLANVRVSGSSVVSAPTMVNSLRIDKTGALTLNADVTLGAGMIWHSMVGSSANAPVIAGSGAIRSDLPLQIVAGTTPSDRSPLEIQASIHAPSMLVGGYGRIRLSGINTLSEGIRVTGGSTVVVGKPEALGTGVVTLNNGALAFEGDTTITNPVHFEQAEYTATSLSTHGLGIGVPTGRTVTFNGPVTGGGILIPSQGALRLNGGGAFFGYLGDTFPSNSSIEINGTWTYAGPLYGRGNIYGNATIPMKFSDGVLSPGAKNAVGEMHIDGFYSNFGDHSTLWIDIIGSRSDLLRVDGLYDEPGVRRTDLSINVSQAIPPGLTYRIVDMIDPSLRFTAFGIADGSIVNSVSGTVRFRLSLTGGDGNDVTLTVLPEPGSLVSLGLVGVMCRRLRKK